MGPAVMIPPGCLSPGPLPAGERATEPGEGAPSSRFEEAPQLLGPRGMPELAQGFGLDLADALAGDREVLADLLQRVLAAVGEAESQAQHLLLSGREGVEHPVGLLAQAVPDHALDR